MALVKIVDIDGVQWEIKDQTARNKITVLEEEIKKLKTIEKWEYTITPYGGHITARRQGNVVSIIATGIGTNEKIPSTIGDFDFTTLPERFRPLERCFYMARVTGQYVTQYGGIIFPDGRINFWTYVDVVDGYFSLSYIVD